MAGGIEPLPSMDSEGVYYLSREEFEGRSDPAPNAPVTPTPTETKTSTRLLPLEPSEWSTETRQLLEGTAAPVAALEGKPEAPAAAAKPSGTLNILKTISHHPTLLQPFLAFAATLAARGVLPRRSSELLALRAAWNCQSSFEWGHHVIYARSAGLSEDEIAQIGSESASSEFDGSEEDRLLLRAADEMHQSHDVSEPTWREMARTFTPAQLVEIPFVVGQYTMLSMVANTTAVPLEDGLPALPPRVTGAVRR